MVYPGNRSVYYAFDSLNRLTNVTDWANRKTAITYDLDSRVTSITRPNGSIRQINYDVAGQTTNIIEKLANNYPIAFFAFNWNSNSTVAWEFAAPLPHTNPPPVRTMTYDADNELATFNGQSVTCDLDGNLTAGPLTNNSLVSYAYNARNQLTSAGGLAYGYDASREPHRPDQRGERHDLCRQPQCQTAAGPDAGPERNNQLLHLRSGIAVSNHRDRREHQHGHVSL